LGKRVWKEYKEEQEKRIGPPKPIKERPIWAPPVEPPIPIPPSESPVEEKKSSKSKLLANAVVVAFLLVCCILLAYFIISKEPNSNLVRSPIANFSLNSMNVIAYDNIQFMDLSFDNFGNILSWSWNFGDSSTSTYQNPFYTYTQPGTYEVRLTVIDNNGKSDDCVKYIKVSPWAGEDGESLDESVMWNGGYLVGGNGHTITLHNNPYATDPTWNELMHFLQQDTTEQIPYVVGSFVCADYAETLHNNAENAGIRAAYVCLELSGVGHGCDAFRTPDRGLVFIDDTNSLVATNCDKQVNIVVGQEYLPTALFSSQQFLSMGTLDSYKIQW